MTSTRKFTRTASMVTLACLLAACAVPPKSDVGTPAQELPLALEPATSVPISASWWTAFGDTQLTALIDEALQNNRDLARAAARIDQSRAALRSASAERLPIVSANASAGRARVSENGAVPLGGASPTGNDFRATLNVSYELDLWSRLARGADAAREELLASAYARDGMRTALAAQVVQSYVTLQALDAQYLLFERTVKVQRESLALQQRRLDVGDIGELDVRQLESELIANVAQLPKLDRARGEASRALAFVLGRSARGVVEGAVDRRVEPAAVPNATDLPGGLPSDLLARRPDVQAAEARLRAAGARIDAARAAYFPSIALTAEFGRESTTLSRLADGPSLIWGVLASLTQPIWNGGRLDAQHDLAQARRREVEVDYRDTVAAAFKEARDALGARSETEASLQSAILQERALSRAAQLTALRFDGGETSRIEVIRAERAQLTAQSQVADARRALAAAQADLFRVLGGGWQATDIAAVTAEGPGADVFTPLGAMRYGIQTIASLVVATVLCQPVLADLSTEASSSSWPAKMIALEQLEPLTPYHLKVRGTVTKGKVTGPAVIRAHVDPTGAVLRAALHASCGNSDLDEAALNGMREMRFKPFLDGGSPIPVTLLAPIHVPARLGRTN